MIERCMVRLRPYPRIVRVHASTRCDNWKPHQTIVLGLATTAQAHPSRPLFQTEYSLAMTHAHDSTAVEACTHAHYDKVARPVGRSSVGRR